MVNTDKIEYIYLHYYNYFFVVACNICKDRELAKDIVQDGFIKILGSTETFMDISHARRYLTGCVKNAAFARLNKEKRIKAMRHDFIESVSVNEPLIARMRGLVAKLNCPMIRTIIHELYFNEKSQIEVSQQYDIDRHTVATKEKKGLKQLLYIINK